VRLHEFERDAIEHSLMSGSVDAAVMLVSNLHDRRSICSRLLLRSTRRLWSCANHRLLHKDSVRLADLAAEPFLMLTVDEAERSAMRYWQCTPHVPNVIFRTLSVEAVRSMVATGDRHGHHYTVRHGLSAVVSRRTSHRSQNAG
jgi:DNA-binding transcriptional LysR family regulator